MLLNIPKTTFDEAMCVATEYSVATPKDAVVLYSVSYLPTKQNKIDALKFVAENAGKMLLDHTECGKQLIKLGLENGTSGLANDEVVKIWKVASRRFIEAAEGEVMAFVKDADKRSVFMTIELPLLIQNIKVDKINGIDKFEFYKKYYVF